MISPSKQFITELTADNSPTLRLKNQDPVKMTTENRPESMHHSGGAATETQYIYGEAARLVAQKNTKPAICVVGLGLGYIEILMAQIFQNFEIHSFEADSELRQSFQDWLENKKAAHLEIYELIIQSYQFDSYAIRQKIIKNQLTLHGALDRQMLQQDFPSFNLICFDAFSSKTTADLWTEDFLDLFIQKICARDCVFTTYACTGVLKRALKKNGFQLIPKKGFTGKRDCTLAVREN